MLSGWAASRMFGLAWPAVAMRAFLGSASLAALPAWLAELPRRPARALLVPTAGNRLKTTPWVQSTITQLETRGVAVTTFDLEGAHRSDTLAALDAADLIWVTGGHPIFLLQHARASGFLDLVRSRVQAGQLYYAGVSSGAALAAPVGPSGRGPKRPAAGTPREVVTAALPRIGPSPGAPPRTG